MPRRAEPEEYIFVSVSYQPAQLSKEGRAFFIQFGSSSVLAHLDVDTLHCQGLMIENPTRKDKVKFLTDAIRFKRQQLKGALDSALWVSCIVTGATLDISTKRGHLEIDLTHVLLAIGEA